MKSLARATRVGRLSFIGIATVFATLLTIGLALPASAQETTPGVTQVEPVTPEVAAAIQETIVGQIAAFQIDDGALALTYAIPRARQVWRTPEEFLTMVRQGYDAIYRPDEFTFEAAVAQGNVALQLVRVRGQDGKTILAQYNMYQQPDGRWLIGSVRAVEIEPEEDTL